MGYTYNSLTCIKQEEEDKRVKNKKEIIIKIKDFSRTGLLNLNNAIIARKLQFFENRVFI